MSEKGYSLKQDIKNNKAAIVIIAACFAFQRMLPGGTCPFVLLTGLPCPACGLTRAGLLLLSGNFAKAWQVHPFIYPIAGLAVFVLVWRYLLRKSLKHLKAALIGLAICMLVFYIIRMFTCFPGDPPMSYYYDNLSARIFYIFTGR